jgi:hypothetical protein
MSLMSDFEVLESHAIACKVWKHIDGLVYADVVRRMTTLPGIAGDIVEIANRIREGWVEEVRFLVDPRDAHLSQDFQTCGFQLIGWLQMDQKKTPAPQGAKPATKLFHLWESEMHGNIRLAKKAAKARKVDFKSVVRTVYRFPTNLRHDLTGDWWVYLDDIRMRERCFREHTVCPATLSTNRKPEPVVKRKKRAQETLVIQKVALDEIASASCPLGFEIRCLTREVMGLKDGIHLATHSTPSLELYLDWNGVLDQMNDCFFSPVDLSSSAAAFALIWDPTDAMTNFGSRGYRIGCMEAGRILERLSLAASKNGMRMQTIGMFDDGKLLDMLELEDYKRLMIFVTLDVV